MRTAKPSEIGSFSPLISKGASVGVLVASAALLAACQSNVFGPDPSKPPSDAYVVSIETKPAGAQCVLDGFAENLHVKSPGQLVIPEEYKDAQIVCTKEGHEEVRDDWYPGSDVEMPAVSWVRTLPKKK
ncbi:hypothetical protein [Pseudovibrio sp. FO-BEG1]|uniref:hypothetical protein n=1 Tax=Pseudovibrio sp. (strain FO-BEG1) TaxID=911045 RepID=UPI0011D1C474|nr:hypothetical protein [Pseudovibrio sp. FO-BEG1]